MDPVILFFVRLVLSVGIAFLLIWFFYPSAGIEYAGILAVFLFGAGYGFEYLRNRKPKS